MNYLWNKNRITYIEKSLAIAKREEVGEGWSGRLGLVDASYYVWNG